MGKFNVSRLLLIAASLFLSLALQCQCDAIGEEDPLEDLFLWEPEDEDDLENPAAPGMNDGGGTRWANVVVSTVVDVGPMLRDWIRHHISTVGFDRVIVFLDDPRGGDDPTGEIGEVRRKALLEGGDPDLADGLYATPVTEESLAAEWGQHLVLVHRGEPLERRLKRLDLWERFGPFYPFEVQARQLMHLALIANVSSEARIDWALHIDNDELWVPPHGEDAASHFAALSADAVTQAVYANVEALPQAEDVPEGTTPFATVTEFLRSELCLSRPEQLRATARVRALRPTGNIYLTSYWVGKIASRVSTGTIVPHDVTRNAVPAHLRDRTRIAVHDDAGGPLILHYPHAGPEAWRSKYARLGSISDVSFDPARVDPSFLSARPAGADRRWPKPTRQLPFARVSRDIVSRAGSSAEAHDAWRKSFVIPKDVADTLRKTGVLVTLTEIARSARKWHARPTGKRVDYKGLPRGGSTRGFRPDTSALGSTCKGFPHFVCHTRSIECCAMLRSPAFLFLQYQLGYKG